MAHQYCGRLGKVASCQAGMFLAYVSPLGRALVDKRLNVPANSRHLGPRERLLPCPIPAISLTTASVGRQRCPRKRLQIALQLPVCPNSSPDHRACNSLTHLPLSSRRIYVYTGGFGLRQSQPRVGELVREPMPYSPAYRHS